MRILTVLPVPPPPSAMKVGVKRDCCGTYVLAEAPLYLTLKVKFG